ncbi:MAG: 3D domain-containing protein [Oscillospiraceae bacterium]
MRKFKSGMIYILSGLKSRRFALAVFAAAVAFLACWIPSRVKTVKIDYDGEVEVVHTAVCDPAEIINSLGIELDPSDKITTSGFENAGFFGDYGEIFAEIRIKSAVEVEIEADKLKYHVIVAQGDTVADALYASGLEVRSTDYLSTAAGKTVEEGEQIKITRVDYIITTEEETIQRGETYRGTSLIANGRTVLVSYGKNGTMLKTYEQKIVDGVMEDKVLVSEDIIKKATNDLYIVGDGSAISPLDYGYSITDGVPDSYLQVFSDVRATGYYAPAGAGTATGRLAQVGYVAVDPKVIPYGTKMWIVGHGDTGFVYGYALAADTGGAMLSGKNFVDLYYDTYYECVLNGLRRVDVYILEWG